MAKKSRSSTPRWLRHRTLITSEGLLLVAVVQELIQRHVNQLELVNWAKVVWMMAVNIGALGLLLVVVQIIAEKSLTKTHAVVQAMPLPTPYLLIHLVVYAALFYLHAYVWHLPVWPMAIQ
jgi:hypothetical protein